MDKFILFGGGIVMIIIGMTVGSDFPAMASVGIGLMWLGLASIR